jgi:hypothetical protein
MTPELLEKSTTTDGKPADPGLENAPAPKPVGPNGQHGAYWVLNEAERAKGFVRPVRDSYVHSGMRPKNPLRDLTEEEQERYATMGYAKFEEYPGADTILGRFWTKAALEKKGCGTSTTMGTALAETYAREPTYYSDTLCVHCNKHLPVEEFVWMDGQVVGS